MKPGLREIVERKRRDLEDAKTRVPLDILKKKKSPAPRDFKKALQRKGEVSLIAELKKASPSAGLLRPRYNVAAGARAYADAGARALSILTEENYFLGDLSHMAVAKKASGLPVLRKDFIFDPYQIYEARAHGADAVLLIVALLEAGPLKDLIRLTRKLKMTPLVEVHDPSEINIAVKAGADVVGVNSRNLKDLTMDPLAFEKMVPLIPEGPVVVAESGVKTPEDVRALKSMGVDAVLVGESFLRQENLRRSARRLVDAGRN